MYIVRILYIIKYEDIKSDVIFSHDITKLQRTI